MSSGGRFRRAAKIAAKKKRRTTFVEIDFKQPITNYGKPIEITKLPLFIEDPSVITKLSDEDAHKYLPEGGRLKLGDEFREYMTLKSLTIQALSTMMEGDERTSPLDNYNLGRIGHKIHEANGGPVELNAEEVSALKPRISRIATPPIWAQASDMLDLKGKPAVVPAASGKTVSDNTRNQRRGGKNK
jgi:hypothetical protein